MFEVPGFHDEIFWIWKDVITSSEMQILKRLGFQMQVSGPGYSVEVQQLPVPSFHRGVGNLGVGKRAAQRTRQDL